MADIRIIPALGAINVTGSADFRGTGASSVLFVSGSGNVGVGTTNPISKLHVAGAIKATSVTGHVLGTSTDTSRALSILNSGLADASTYAITLGYGASNNNQAEIGFYLAGTGSASNRLSLGLYNSSDTVNILGSGKVGIGITNPTGKLDINGASDYNQLWIRSAGGNAAITFDVETGASSYYNWRIDAQGQVANGMTFAASTAAGGTTFGTPVLTLLQTGIVKINDYGSGTNTGTAAYGLAVDSSGNVIETTLATINGSGTANYVPKWSDSDTLTDSVIYQNGTNVGINTTAPSGSLHIKQSTASDQGKGYEASNFPDLSTQTASVLTLDGNYTSGAYRSRFIKVDRGGNLSVYYQETSGTPHAYTSKVRFGANSHHPAVMQVFGPFEATNQIRISNGSGTQRLIMGNRDSSGTNNPSIIAAANGNLYFGGGDTWNPSGSIAGGTMDYTMTLTDSGSVGIGTTSPAEKLHVVGEGLFAATGTKTSKEVGTDSSLEVEDGLSIFRRANTYGWLLNSNSSNNFGIYNWNRNGYVFTIKDNATSGVFTISGGSVGINDNTPDYNLDVNGTGRFTDAVTMNSDLTVDGIITAKEFHTTFVSASIIYQSGSTQFGNSSDDTHIFTGNVGIGTNSPGIYTLNVAGNTLIAKSEAASNWLSTWDNTATNGHKMYFGYGNAAGTRYGLYIQGGNGNTDLDLAVADKFYVLGNGSVGIGTGSPGAKLHVSGSARINGTIYSGDGSISTSNSLQLQYDAASGDGVLSALSTGGSTSLALQTANSGTTATKLYLTSGGSVRLNFYGSGNNTGTAAYNLSVDSSGNIIETANPSLTGTGTANYITKWSGTNTLTNSVMYDDGTNIGVGETSPSYKLHVGGTFRASGLGSFGGSVGIGTTSPDAVLVVSATSTSANAVFNTNANGGYITLRENGTDRVYLQWGLTISGSSGGNYTLLTNSESGASIALQTRQSGGTYNRAALVVDSSGNIGIDTISPSARLDVYQSGSTALNIAGSQGQLFSVTDSLSGSLMSVNDISGIPILEVFSDDRVVAGTFGSNALVVNGSSVGVGTSSPNTPLEVYGGAGMTGGWNKNTTLAATYPVLILNSNSTKWAGIGYDYSVDGIRIWTNATSNDVNGTGSERLSIIAGNVGIGSGTPGHKLDVAGTARIKDSLYLGDADTASGHINAYELMTFNIDTDNDDADTRYFGWFKNGAAGSGTALMRLTEAGNLGIGTTAPGALLHVSGSDAILRNAFIGEVPTYTSVNAQFSHIDRAGIGEYSFLSAADGTTFVNAKTGQNIYFRINNSDKVIVNSSGNVGINTTSPATKLQVDGQVTILSNATAETPKVPNALIIANSDDATQALRLGYDSGSDIGVIAASDAGTGWKGIAIAPTGGSVGIGSFSPGYKLDVNGTAGFRSTIYAANIGTGEDNSVVVLDSDGTLRTDEIDSRVWGSTLVDGSGTANRVAYWSDADTLTSDADFTFDGTSVGIGTTSPAYKLDVSGSVRLGGIEANNLPIRMGHDAQAIYMGGLNTNTLNVAYDYNGAYNMHINYNGYLGADTQYRNLVINNGRRALIAHFDGASRYVGIGTFSPSATLHVAGNALFEGNMTVDGIITAKEFHTTFVSASIVFQSGSTQFGNSIDDVHTFTGKTELASYGVGATEIYTYQVATSTSTTSNETFDLYLGRFGNGYHKVVLWASGYGTDVGNYFDITRSWGTSSAPRIISSGGFRVGAATYTIHWSQVSNSAYDLYIKWTAGMPSGYTNTINYSIQSNTGGSYVQFEYPSVTVPTLNASNQVAALATIDYGNAKVGIGITNPAYANLTVSAGSHQGFAVTRAGNNVPALFLGNDGGSTARIAANNANLQIGRDLSDTFTPYVTVENGSGNVGIGLTNPSYKLTVMNSAGATVNIGGGNSNTIPAIAIQSTSGSWADSTNGFAYYYNATDGDLDLYRKGNSATEAHVMTWQRADGNVGIGTTSPETLLKVRKDQAAETAIEIQNNTGAGADTALHLSIGDPASNDARITFNIGNGGYDWAMGVDNSDGDSFKISGGTDSHKPSLGTNDRLKISGAGLVTAIEGFAAGGQTVYNNVGSDSGAGIANGFTASLQPGLNTMSTQYDYRVTLNTMGTGTINGARYIIGHNGTQWNVREVGRSGTSSNHPELTTAGNSIIIYDDHANGYNVHYRVETYYRGQTNTTLHTFGSDYHWQRTVDNLTYVDGNVGIGTTAPADKFEIYNGTYHKIKTFFEGSYTSGFKFSDYNGGIRYDAGNDRLTLFANYTAGVNAPEITFETSGSEQMRIDSYGNVGIGNTNAITKLHVATAGRPFTSTADKSNGDMVGIVLTANTNENTMNGIWFSSGTDHSGTHWSGIAGSRSDYATNWSTHLAFFTHVNATTNITQATEKMRITGEGSVGIGTTSPGAKLQVHSPALGTTAGDQVYQSMFYGNNGNGSYLEIKDVRDTTGTDWTSAGKRIQLRIDSTYMGYIQFNGYNNNYGISFGTGGTTSAPGDVSQRMVITSAGQVTINNNAAAGIVATNFRVYGYDSDSYFRLGNNTSNSLNIELTRSDAATMFSVDGHSGIAYFAGSVGIGNTSPTAKLQVGAEAHGSATGIEVAAGTSGANLLAIDDTYNHNWFPYTDGNNYYSAGGHTFRDQTHSTVWMFISSSGCIGIGTVTPSYKLDVTGDLRATSNIIANGYTVTDGIIHHASNINVLNKASNGWLTWATRNTSGAEVVVDLDYIGSVSTSGNITAGGTLNTSRVSVDSAIVFDTKTMTMTNSFSDALTVNMNNHTGCYVKITAFGDWSSHSSISYLGEFFLQNGAGSYNEPGRIIRQVDNTYTDHIEAQIVDPSGTSGARDFVIQLKATAAASFTAYLQYEVRGMFNSVS